MLTPAAPITDALWAEIGPIFAAIERHPFLLALADGSLARDRFAFYITQDSIYLRSFARVLAALAASGPDEATALFARHAADAIKVEQDLHTGLIAELGLHTEQVRSADPAPTCLAYTSFLLSVALGRPFHEGLGAVLPCYWIYQKVGQGLAKKGSPDALYQRWISTYGGPQFDTVVREVLDLTNAVAPGLTGPERAAMRRHFVTASRYEWMFWDMAQKRERWPV